MSHHEHEAHEHAAPTSYGIYILIWLILLVFTGLTVAVAGINMAALSIPVALGIAGTKALLVLLFFMHIKYEDRVFTYGLGVLFVTIAVILILTFSDILFR